MKSMKQIQTLLISAFILICPINLHSQGAQLPDVLGRVPSPQATDLGRYGDIPVSYYTGRANITVPIQSFTQRDVTLDINLTYDTSGLLMNKLPGWVGPGWTLNAGGCITRVQRNCLDEHILEGPYGFTNYFQAYQYILEDGHVDSSTVINNYNKDYAPDLFYFNFLGKTGCFFLGNDGKWKISSDDNLVVEFNINDNNNLLSPIFTYYPKGPGFPEPKTIKGFTIYDEKGNKYVFGGSTQSIEYSMDLYKSSYLNEIIPWGATCWYLTSVEDRLGNILYELTYDRGYYLVQLFNNQTNPYNYSGTLNLPLYLSSIKTYMGDSIDFFFSEAYSAGQTAKNLYDGHFQTSSYSELLSGIPASEIPQKPFYYLQCRNDTTQLFFATEQANEYDPLSAMGIKRLTKISIRSGLSTETVDYMFNYDENGRYHLSSISTYGNSFLYGSYTFTYNDYNSIPKDHLTKKRDSRGYFLETGHSSPCLECCKKGMLTKIVYPTGGCSLLEYELHSFSRMMTLNRTSMIDSTGIVSGLRILSITDSTQYNPNKKRYILYNNPSTGKSSGQYYADPDDDSYYTIAWRYDVYGNNSDPVMPLCTSLKTCVGYSYVKDSIAGGGEHIYCYRNFDDDSYTPTSGLLPVNNEMEVGNFEDPSERKGFMRGRLASEYIIQDNVIDKIIHYEYRTDAANFLSQVVYGFDPNYHDSSTHTGGFYKLYHPKYDIQRVATSTKAESNVINDTTTYTMTDFGSTVDTSLTPNFRLCTQEKISRKGENIQKNYTYQHYSPGKYFFPLTTTTTRYNGMLMQTDIVHYATFESKEYPKYESITVGNGTPDTLVTFHSYTSNGQPQEYTRKGEYPTRLYWNSTHKDRLNGSVSSPDALNNVLTPNTSASSPLYVLQSGNQSIFNFPNVKATAFLYNAKGQICATATENGLVRNYYYDILGRLIRICDGNGKTLKQFLYHYSTGENNNLEL